MAEKIGEIDIDTLKAQYSIEMANRKIERMQNVVTGADKRMRTWEKTWGAVSRIAAGFGAALSAQAIVGYIKSLGNLNSELEETRKGFLAGSKAEQQFNKATEGFGDAQARQINSIKTGWISLKAAVSTTTVKILEGLKLMGDTRALKVLGGTANEEDMAGLRETMGFDKQGKQKNAALDTLNAYRESEKAQAAITANVETQLDAIGKQLALEKAIIAQKTAEEDPELGKYVLEGNVRIANLMKEQRAIEFSRQQEADKAALETRIMTAKAGGQKQIAEQLQIELKYNGQIAEAKEKGLAYLERELTAQRDLEVLELRRAKHTMTARERLAERSEERKTLRENKQTAAAEAEFAQRAAKGIKATKGSEYYKYLQSRGMVGAGGAGPKGPEQASLTAAQINTLVTDIATIAGAFKGAP